ncbi:hypothetical protein LTV02_28585 [Nocardia yamanashiensis]|uniref:hypothetical protein n=1 Tax=Nocardia yamanashiensis TaxID=209247 RepID=UPI001E62217E|nr:hypothetical protein [Nocardia yamanashiensis]UGT39975.1 hypothetical protein LTV02_28585 [Nocardia yamanashiensis]
MSETSGVTTRTRRRAVRSEGPPPEERGVASPVLDTVLPVADKAPADQNSAAADVAATAEVATPERAAEVEVPAAPEDTVKLDKPAAPEPATAIESETDSAASESTDTESGETEAPAVASASGSRWMQVLAAACVVLAVVGLAGTGFFLYERNQAADLEAQRTEYVQFAAKAMTTIVNVNGDTAGEDFAKALEVTSGDFAADLAKRKDGFAELIQKAQVKVKGEVVGAALESSDDHSAIVLVGVKQQLTNSGAQGEQQRQYRFRVTLAKDGDKLSVTGMEMVL